MPERLTFRIVPVTIAISICILISIVPCNGDSKGSSLTDDLTLIPWPVKVDRESGSLSLKNFDGILISVYGEPWQDILDSFRVTFDKIEGRTGIKVNKINIALSGKKKSFMHFNIDSEAEWSGLKTSVTLNEYDQELTRRGKESYRLEVGEDIKITAIDPHGFFNAGMTLLQLIEKEGDEWAIPRVRIFDYPRFSHRGLLLDPARRFDTMEEVRRYVDLISELKMNVFHFHLTDDQGWRLESKKFPLLHEVGGTDGYYTQEQIRELIEFAAARHVTVIPEIDMPGHCRAMLAAYPELSCSGEDVEVAWWTYWIYKTALCPCREETYEFLDELLGEVASLFPSEHIHIGNDEVVPKDWLDYPGCQELMEREGLEGVEGLQSYFVARVDEILAGHGRKMIAWDETVDYAPEGVIIQSWHGNEPSGRAARAGNPAIVSPFTPWYLSYPWWMWSMKDAYLYEPMPEGLSEKERELVMGGEACMWQPFRQGRYIDTGLFPRVLAIAEVLWSPAEARDFRRFKRRVGQYRPVLKEKGVKIRKWQLQVIPEG